MKQPKGALWSIETFGSLAELIAREDEIMKHLDCTTARYVRTFRVEGLKTEAHTLVVRRRA